eukprot:gnl/TRDRNA2_/TRDRNA2_131818_c1_seq4.p1 gnl/TRDRNA2_/TRDRNA2_131818_c1~~gnl/TRDRNA2_/TRDRNA2_131818_c1_seq4.p1  ORF type:complete len:540 (+),score=121.95 gnl/TRDRNA2_/TRDRNA2_131818_c1_seq4:102-1721(+)
MVSESQVGVSAQEIQARAERYFALSRAVRLTFCGVALVGALLSVVFDQEQSVPQPVQNTDPKTPADILLHQLRRLEANGGDQELVLRTSLGNIYKEDGHYDDAVMQYSLAQDIAVKLGGSDRLATQLLALGNARRERGRLSAARKDLEMAYVLVDKEHAVEQAIEVLRRLGDVERDQGKLEEALEAYKKADKMAKKHLSGTALAAQKAVLLTDLGDTYARKGRMEEAMTSLRSALKNLEEVRRGPTDSPFDVDAQWALTSSVLGSVLHIRGDSVQAMDLYRKALRQQVKLLRPGHSDLVLTRLSIARAHRDMGERDRAMESLEAVEQTVRSGPHEGPDLARVLTIKADLLREQKQYVEATEAVDEALMHQGICFAGEASPETAVTLTTYGSLLHDQGQYDEALRMYKRALQLNMETVGYDHPETAANHNSIGTLYQDLGDDLSAQQHFEKTLDIQQRTVGDVSADMATTYNNLATILYRRGELEDAAGLLGKALEVLDKVGASENSPDRLIYKDNLNRVVSLIQKKSEKSGKSETGLLV